MYKKIILVVKCYTLNRLFLSNDCLYEYIKNILRSSDSLTLKQQSK